MEPLHPEKSELPRTRPPQAAASEGVHSSQNNRGPQRITFPEFTAVDETFSGPPGRDALDSKYLKTLGPHGRHFYIHQVALKYMIDQEQFERQSLSSPAAFLRQMQRLAGLRISHAGFPSRFPGNKKRPLARPQDIAENMLDLLMQVADKDMSLCDRLLRCLQEHIQSNIPSASSGQDSDDQPRLLSALNAIDHVGNITLFDVARVFSEGDLVPEIEVDSAFSDIELDKTPEQTPGPLTEEILNEMRKTPSGRQRLASLGPRAVRGWVSRNDFTNPTPKLFYVKYLRGRRDQTTSREHKELWRMPVRAWGKSSFYLGARSTDVNSDAWFRFLFSLNVVDLDSLTIYRPEQWQLLYSKSLPARVVMQSQYGVSPLTPIYRLAELRARCYESVGALILRMECRGPVVPSTQAVADEITAMQAEIAEYSMTASEKFMALLKNEANRCHEEEAGRSEWKKSVLEKVKYPEEIEVFDDDCYDTEEVRAILASKRPIRIGTEDYKIAARDIEPSQLFYKVRRVPNASGGLSTEKILTLLPAPPQQDAREADRQPKRLRLENDDESSSSTSPPPAKRRATGFGVDSTTTGDALSSSSSADITDDQVCK